MLGHCYALSLFLPCGSACSCSLQGLPSQPQVPDSFSILAHQLLTPTQPWKADNSVPLFPWPLNRFGGVHSSPCPPYPVFTSPSTVPASDTCPK